MAEKKVVVKTAAGSVVTPEVKAPEVKAPEVTGVDLASGSDSAAVTIVTEKHPAHTVLDVIDGKLNDWRICADAEIRALLAELRATL